MTLHRPGDRRDGREYQFLMLGAFLFAVAGTLCYHFPKDAFGSTLDEYVYTDWLIDYSHGFVRRGLSGALIHLLSVAVRPKLAVSLLSWGIFVAFACGYFQAVRRSLDRWSPTLLAGLLFLPSLCLFYVYDHGTIGRKETIGYLILWWHLHRLKACLDGKGGVYGKRFLPLGLIALPVHILMHEASFLQFVPVHFLLSWSALRADPSLDLSRRLRWLAALYLPACLTFLVVFRFGQPSLETAVAMTRHWETLGALAPGSSDIAGRDFAHVLPGSLAGLTWTFRQAISLTLSLTALEILEWVLVFIVLGYFAALLGCLATERLAGARATGGMDARVFRQPLARRMLLKYFVVPWLVSLPLYLLGWDLGRWFAVTCVSYMFIALSPEVVRLEKPAISSPPVERPDDGAAVEGEPRFSRSFFVHLAVLLPTLLYLRLPRCCIDLFGSLASGLQLLLKRL